MRSRAKFEALCKLIKEILDRKVEKVRWAERSALGCREEGWALCDAGKGFSSIYASHLRGGASKGDWRFQHASPCSEQPGCR